MTQQTGEPIGTRPVNTDDPPVVIVLGDAAALTRGSDDSSVENKSEPYD